MKVLLSILATLCLNWCLSCAAQAQGTDAPRRERIVSLYLCTDELLLQLADPGFITSVTWLSRDPTSSNVAALARRMPVNRGRAEEIIAQRPDLILAGAYTARAAVAVLRRTGVPIVEIGVPRTLADMRAEIRTVAGAVGEPGKGERMIEMLDARLNALPVPPEGRRPRAMVLNPNGFTIGKGSLVDEIFERAGLENLAATLDIASYGQLPLELVLRSGVDILILNVDRDGPPSLATEFLRHPALAKLAGRARLLVMPSRLWTCSGPGIVEAIERLYQAANDLRIVSLQP